MDFFVITTVIFLGTTLYFAFRKKAKVVKEPYAKIDPELENQLASYENALYSIVKAKSIKQAREIAEEALPILESE